MVAPAIAVNLLPFNSGWFSRVAVRTNYRDTLNHDSTAKLVGYHCEYIESYASQASESYRFLRRMGCVECFGIHGGSSVLYNHRLDRNR